jgi:putative YphP/YqiW family bacilliredoxin
MPPKYDTEAVADMWEELVRVGFRTLTTEEQVDDALRADAPGTVLLVINSVCGCAGGSCRPGVMAALQHDRIPDDLLTVFAGVDPEATECARAHMPGVPPSSPCVVLLKEGKPQLVMERRHIEGMPPSEVARVLRAVFDEHCTRTGPSVSSEEYRKIIPVQECGSTIPLYPGD